jgi:2'-5' RNA ligase
MNTRHQTLVSAGNSQLSLFPQTKTESPVMDAVHQYFFVISPSEVIKTKVKLLKHQLHNAVGLSDYNLHSVPHISLMSFHTMRPVNERFIQAVQQLFSKNNIFEIKLNGFEHFAHGTSSNTIYAKIQDSEQMSNLYEELNLLLGFRVRSFIPHLTIARSIPRANFDKSFSFVKQYTFDEVFSCNQVTILERKLQHGVVSKFQVLKEMRLDECHHVICD